MQNKLDKALDLLERPAYVQVLLCVASGKDYATSIARFLKKKQPTVTEQLQELKNAGLIRELERGKYKRFKVNWDLLLKVFYDTVNQLLDLR
ncbi:MAG: helix-turn-helix domain-containing protein, partial [Candidatus Baldrarchaeia archaeon]